MFPAVVRIFKSFFSASVKNGRVSLSSNSSVIERSMGFAAHFKLRSRLHFTFCRSAPFFFYLVLQLRCSRFTLKKTLDEEGYMGQVHEYPLPKLKALSFASAKLDIVFRHQYQDGPNPFH